jgi:predicted dienelactone hydrolase
VAGGWPSWKGARIKAVLALSPYSAPFMRQHTLSQVQVPVMYQGGTRDPGITPSLKKGNGAYEQTPGPKYYVEFKGATHFAWTDLSNAYRGIITAYSIAFLDQYLKDKPFPQALASPIEGISAFRMQP